MIEYKNNNLQNYLLNSIWLRTRLIFVPEEGELHPIIPTNLRELHQFAFVLLEMEAVEGDNKQIFTTYDDYEKIKLNFENFKTYILDKWIKSNLSTEERKVFENMPLDIKRINKHLIQSINVIGNKNKKRLLAREVDISQTAKAKIDRDIYTMVSHNDPKFYMANRISDIYNHPSNNSMGDVLLLIDKYQTYFESVEEVRFINAVKIYYTMLLFETMFFKNETPDLHDDVKKQTGTGAVVNTLENLVAKSDIDNIQTLIGGTVYFPHYFDIITSGSYKVELTEGFDSGRGDRIFYHQYLTEPQKEKRLTIFEAFFVAYYGKNRPERSLNKRMFETTYESGIVRFDILSLLSNLLNPMHTIKRTNNISKLKNQVEPCWEKEFMEVVPIIQEWIDSDKLNLPKCILPIYSVDLMLQYLRKQCLFEDITEHDEHKIWEDKRNIQEALKMDLRNNKRNRSRGY